MDKKQIIKKKIIHYMTKDQKQESLMRFKHQLVESYIASQDHEREHFEYANEPKDDDLEDCEAVE